MLTLEMRVESRLQTGKSNIIFTNGCEDEWRAAVDTLIAYNLDVKNNINTIYLDEGKLIVDDTALNDILWGLALYKLS